MDMQQILIIIIKTVPYLVLFILPFRGRLCHSAGYTIGFGAVCSAIFSSLHMYIIRCFGQSIPAKLLMSVLSIGLMVFLARWLINISLFSFLFLILMCKNYIDIILLAGGELYPLFREESAALCCAAASLAFMAATLPLCYLLLKNFLSTVFDVSEHLSFWKYLWVLPAFYFLMYRLLIYPRALHAGTGVYPDSEYLAPFWIAMVLISYFFLFRVMVEILRSVELKEQLHSAGLLAQMQKEQYIALQNSIEEARRNRHDLKQQLIVIREYIRQGEYQEAVVYIGRCLEINSCQVENFCSNYAVNSIVRYYAGMARANQIETKISIDLPEPFDFSEIDFCTLLGNLMLNAVEAGIRKKSGKRYIHLQMAPAGSDMLALTISNAYDGEVCIKDGVFYSSKRDGEGIGTVSVRHIVKKNQGILKYRYENGVFETSILLRFPGQGKSMDIRCPV